MTRKTEMVEVAFIEEDMRLREVREDAVDRLAASMADIGMRTPISVRYFPDKPGSNGTDDSYHIVTGAHRLAAAKKLGWDKIECFVVECDEIDAELWEIAENLHRAELTALERDEQVARWVELTELKQIEADKLSASRPGQKGVPASVADELGVNRKAAQRAVRVASLTDEAKEAAREVGLDDNRTALLAAAKAEPSQQAAVIRDYAEKRQVDRNKIDDDIQARAVREVAEMIAEHVPGEWWDALKANLYAAKDARRIANELTNITGQSIMDRRYGS